VGEGREDAGPNENMRSLAQFGGKAGEERDQKVIRQKAEKGVSLAGERKPVSGGDPLVAKRHSRGRGGSCGDTPPWKRRRRRRDYKGRSLRGNCVRSTRLNKKRIGRFSRVVRREKKLWDWGLP